MISIRSGDVTARIDADRGGRLAAIDVAGSQLLVGPSPDRDPMHWGSFPMVPWAGRIRHGRFTFDGRPYELPLDLPPHAIHGTAYRQAWDTHDVADDNMAMSCDLAWELGGRAWQYVAVTGEGVTCVLGVAAGAHPMPAQVGWHPWFAKPESLGFRPLSMYARDDDGIPSGDLLTPPPGPWDDCFVNTDPVELRYPDLTVTVASDCDHWVVFDEPAHATCVEPQSGAPDAFNRHPLVLLPGEQLVRTMTIGWGDRLASHDRVTMR